MEIEYRHLINDIGKALTYRRVSKGAYNTSTGLATNTTTDTSVKGIVLNYKDNQFDGDIIQRGDRKIVLRASDSIVPDVQDFIIDGSDYYRIISVRQIEQAGADLVYVCQGRI
jgi:hypothetical protein